MLAGELYRPDAEIAADHAAAERWMTRYNASGASSAAELNALLSERFRKVGKDTIIRPPRFTRHMHSPFPPRSAIPCAQSSNAYRSSYSMP